MSGAARKIAGRKHWRGVLVAALLMAATAGAGGAFVVVGQASDDVPAEDSAGFTLPKEDSRTLDKLDDFNRYVEKRSWELAFRTMNSLADTQGSGMVPAGDGFWVPMRRRIRQSLVKLPAEGRDAYRLFNDAAAKQLWEQAKSTKNAGDELRDLQKLSLQYFLSSVGDLATDRLGDLLFERGDFGGAEAAWESVVRDYPDLHVSAARLQVKRCAALLRLGRRDELGPLAQRVIERYGDQKMVIGGEEVAAGDFVQRLLKESNQAGGPEKVAEQSDDLPAVALAGDAATEWTIRVAPEGMLEKMDAKIAAMGWGYRGTHFAGIVPGAAVDDSRVYVNWLGVVYAADLETGKMLWRTGKFSDIEQRTMNFVRYGTEMANFVVSVSGGKVFATTQDPQRGDGMSQFICYDAATGKPLWRGDRLGGGTMSLPYVVGSTGYSVGGTPGDTANLVAFNVDTGTVEWRVPLGKAAAVQSYNGMTSSLDPVMVLSGGMLYVATNNGALLAVSVQQRRVEWALRHETKAAPPGPQWGYYPTSDFEMGPTLVCSEGLLLVKDSGGRRMYGVDPSGPTMAWQRPIDAEDMVIGVEEGRAILLGRDLSAMDLKTRALLWSTKIPVGSGVRPLMAKGHIFVPTTRGIYDIDAASGDTRRIFRAADHAGGGGGRLLLAGDKLISVGDDLVAAYRVKVAKGDVAKNAAAIK